MGSFTEEVKKNYFPSVTLSYTEDLNYENQFTIKVKFKWCLGGGQKLDNCN